MGEDLKDAWFILVDVEDAMSGIATVGQRKFREIHRARRVSTRYERYESGRGERHINCRLSGDHEHLPGLRAQLMRGQVNSQGKVPRGDFVSNGNLRFVCRASNVR